MSMNNVTVRNCNIPSSFPSWETVAPSGKGRLSAVLIPLFKTGKKLEILFLERQLNLKHHGGEMCFPGGERERYDKGPLETALRETEEEIGLKRENIRPLYLLDPHRAISSGFTVYPVVGNIVHETLRSSLLIEPKEVASTAFMSLDDIPEVPRSYRLEHGGNVTETPCYDLPNGKVVWGVTAYILRYFITMVRKGEINLCL